MRPSWLALALPSVLWAASACADQRLEDELKRSFAQCKAAEGAEAKLACYERIGQRFSPPTFQGRLTLQTDLFDIDRPTLIRFESDGVIFVMYLKDERGDVVQNLHIGGGGASEYLVEKAGKYSLLINGAESWRVWIEPRE